MSREKLKQQDTGDRIQEAESRWCRFAAGILDLVNIIMATV